MTDLSFFVPCLNEEKNIIPTINKIISSTEKFNLKYEICIVDDNSSDNTYQEVVNFKNKNPNIKFLLIKNKFTKGLGTNYVDVAFLAKGKYYMLVNGDNAEPEDTLILILNQLGKSDMIIPFFSNQDNRSFTRVYLSKIFTLLVNFISGNKIPYYNGPVLHLRYNVMRWSPDTHGFAYQAELITRILSEGATYETVKITNQDRMEGNSNAFTFANILSVFHSLLQIFLRRLRNLLFYRNKSN